MRTVPLGEVVEFIRGITFKPADVVGVGAPGSVPCMRTKNVQADLDLRDVLAVPRSFVGRPNQFLQYGDVLVSSANSWNLVGKCSWVGALPWEASFGGFVTVARPSSSHVDRRFLYRWMSSQRVQHEMRSFGQSTTNISNLNLRRCREMAFPLPPIEEQRRIAAVLDAADALRAKRRLALAKLDTLAQSIFINMFGDPATNPLRYPRLRLGEIAARFSDGPFGSNLTSADYVPAGVRVIRLQNIGVGEFVNNDAAYISDAHFEQLIKHECRPGDVLVGTLGDPNLRACVQPSFLPVALNKADCVQIRVDDSVATADWCAALLNCPATAAIASGLVHGQTRSRISMGRLRELVVPVPPVAMQQQFSARVPAIDATKDSVRRATAQIDTLFAALQRRAFRGEL